MTDDRARQALLTLNDSVLAPFIEARDEAEREATMERILVDHATPVVRRVIATFRSSPSAMSSEDLEDVASTVNLRLVRRLRSLLSFEGEAIARLDDYVATLTYHTLYDFLRRRFPERTRLKNRTRYLLTHDRRFDFWSTSSGMLCGLRAWGKNITPLTTGLIEIPAHLPDRNRAPDAVQVLLQNAGRPVLLEDLVAALAQAWKISDSQPRVAVAEELAAPPGADLETRQIVETLWREILQLRPNQRTALLLNMRDADGANAVALITLLGIASLGEIAAAVGLPEEKFAEQWNKLPLDDLTIAGILGLTRQQVISLRKAARLRLARRLSPKSERKS